MIHRTWKFPLKEPVAIALTTLREHKLRSFLTLFGIILSVCTLIVVIALIEGTDRYIADRVANMGSNVFLLNQFGIVHDAQEFAKLLRRNKRITWEDFEYVRDSSRLAKAVGGEVRRFGTLRAGTETLEDSNIRGVTANIGEMDVEEPATGRYISDPDNEQRAMVTFIGADVSTRLFPNVEPIGRTLRVDGREYEIIGVAKPVGTVFGQSQDNFVYIPIRTYMKYYGANNLSISVNIQCRGAEWMARTQEESRMLMRARRHLAPGDEDNFGILASESVMGLWKQLTGAISSTMVGVVSVFLVVGGVVIMNVMLASVTERTREIGVRKSLGARRRDILMQFIVESSVLAACGGAIGVALSYVIAAVVTATTSLPTAVPIAAVALAIGISTSVGLFFGVYPARKAAGLDPIEALRYET